MANLWHLIILPMKYGKFMAKNLKYYKKLKKGLKYYKNHIKSLKKA